MIKRFVVPFCLALLAACSMKSLRDITNLVTALNTRFGQTFSVNIMNGEAMTITAINAPQGDLPEDERAQYAHAVAKFARENYPSADSLRSITVAFMRQHGGGGFSYSRGEGAYTYAPSELVGPPDSGEPTMENSAVAVDTSVRNPADTLR